MKRPAALFLIIILVSSCVSHDLSDRNTCHVADPVTELDWLRDGIQEINSSSYRRYWYITQATYQGQTVFLIRNCCPVCLTTPPPVINCQGDRLFYLGNEHQGQINGEAIIWKPADYACTI